MEHPLLSPEANEILRANITESRVIVANHVLDSARSKAEAEDRIRHELYSHMAEFLRREKTEKIDRGDTTEYRLKLYVLNDETLYKLIQQEAMRFARFTDLGTGP